MKLPVRKSRQKCKVNTVTLEMSCSIPQGSALQVNHKMTFAAGNDMNPSIILFNKDNWAAKQASLLFPDCTQGNLEREGNVVLANITQNTLITFWPNSIYFLALSNRGTKNKGWVSVALLWHRHWITIECFLSVQRGIHLCMSTKYRLTLGLSLYFEVTWHAIPYPYIFELNKEKLPPK